ncbi:MAG: hypothetical protein U9N83_06425 [Thermodesulfobacteriota bacterium]|nr:hypothetical protein [Thermodesulfobacteriota bacterium]
MHHIIIRGIERRKIFYDGSDLDNFLNRLGIILTDTFTPQLSETLTLIDRKQNGKNILAVLSHHKNEFEKLMSPKA